MAARKKKKKKKKSSSYGSGLHKLAVLLMSAVLGVCVASVAVGVINWHGGEEDGRVDGVLRIEILNGTGEKGLARKVAIALIKKKVDVLHVDNAKSFDYKESVLIARSENPAVATLGELIGCRRVVEQLTEDTMFDATFIIGDDVRKLDIGLERDSDLSE